MATKAGTTRFESETATVDPDTAHLVNPDAADADASADLGYASETSGIVAVNPALADTVAPMGMLGDYGTEVMRDPPQTLEGTGGNDFITGGSGHDTILGFAGNDWLAGGGGNDEIRGGEGDDIMVGGAGHDVMQGDDGSDWLLGEAGNDRMHGGDGDDVLNGGDGRDIIDGSLGNDVVIGGAGNDILWGHIGEDSLIGGSGNDALSGGNGTDIMTGGAGRDTFDVAQEEWGWDPLGSFVLMDVITDFSIAEGDVVALGSALTFTDWHQKHWEETHEIGEPTVQEAFADRYFFLQQYSGEDGYGTLIYVDSNGSASGGTISAVADLMGVTANQLSLDPANLGGNSGGNFYI